MKLKITESQFITLRKVLSEQDDTKARQTVGNFFSALNNITQGAISNNGNESLGSTKYGSDKYSGQITPVKNWAYPLGIRGRISSYFGNRAISVGTSNHKGVDIATPSGTRVICPADGIVIYAGDTTPNGCGGHIRIDHGQYQTKFCHLKQWNVKVGDQVKRSQPIGLSGGGPMDRYRGTSTGPHLHYEIVRSQDNASLNPLQVQTSLA